LNISKCLPAGVHMIIVGYEVAHRIEDANWQGDITYRFDGLGIGQIGWWSYKPEHRDYWTEVRNYDICRLLDRGLHSRDFEAVHEIKKKVMYD
jgi:hypothetical protein